MSYNSKIDADFTHYLQSMVNLDALDRMTEDLSDELQDSQQVMNQIKGLLDSLPKNPQDIKPEPNSGFQHEDLSKFLNDSTPKLLMPDMDENTCDVDLDDVIATMKSYAEDIKKSLLLAEPVSQVGNVNKPLENLDLGEYACSLDVLCKRLNNLKIKQVYENLRNPELEAKLSVLCDDVKMFTKMVQANTTLCEVNKNWTPTQQQPNTFDYDTIICKLLSGINQVSYLLHDKNAAFHGVQSK